MTESDSHIGKSRCVIYARYSSKLQKEKSIEDQVAMCESHARREGWQIIETYADRALSGTSMAPRTSLLKMLKDAQEQKYDIVLTEGLDRLSRNQVDTAYLYQALLFADVQIYSMSDSAFVNEMHVGFKGIQHSQFIKDLGMKTRRGQEGTVKKGRISGSVAFGYRIVRSIETPTGGREVDDEQAVIVKRIFDEWNNGVSVLAIAKRLNQEGFRGPNGGLWRPSTIFGSAGAGTGILRNDLYRGVNTWGKNQTRRSPSGKKVRKLAPKSALVVVNVPQLRIIEDDVWFAAQKRLEDGRALSLHKRKRPMHLLSGRIVCAECQSGYILLNGNRYGCSGRSTLGVCQVSRRFGREEFEACVLDLITEQLLDPTLIREYVREYEIEYRKQAESAVADSRALERRGIQIEAELSRLIGVLKNSDTAGAASTLITAEINKLSTEQQQINVSLSARRLMSVKPIDAVLIEEKLKARFTLLQTELRGPLPGAASARDAIRALIDRVVVAPHGDTAKRTGSVSIRVEGKIASLLGASESDEVHAILSCTCPRAGQYRANDMWCVLGILEPASYRRPVEKYRSRLSGGSLKYDEFLLGELGHANVALTAADMSRGYLGSQRSVATVKSVRKWSHTFRQRLHALKELGLIGTVRLPGKDHQGWIMAERMAELCPAAPALKSTHQDNEFVFSELNRASRPLTINDLARAVIRSTGERPTPSRLDAIKVRLRSCLRHHRKAGIVAPVNVPGSSAHGWVLSERQEELSSRTPSPVRVGPLDGKILAVMNSANGRLTAGEMAAQVFGQLDKSHKLRLPTVRSVTNRVWTFLRSHRRNGNVHPVMIKGKKAQGWEWLPPPPNHAIKGSARKPGIEPDSKAFIS